MFLIIKAERNHKSDERQICQQLKNKRCGTSQFRIFCFYSINKDYLLRLAADLPLRL